MTLLEDNLQNCDILVNESKVIPLNFIKQNINILEKFHYLLDSDLYTTNTPIVNKFFPTIRAQNTEVHVQKNKKICLIVTGESWTYGDRLMYDSDTVVKSIDSVDSLDYRINNIFAGHCARLLDADLYLSAVPGNSNTGIVFHLPNILEHIKKFNYEKIYVIVQLTSPGRCFADERWSLQNLYWKNYMGNNLGVTKPVNDFYSKGMITMDQWYDLYEYGMTELIKSFCNNITDVLVWKNFNPIRRENLPCSTAKLSWVEYLAVLYNQKFDMPDCNEAGWFDDYIDNIWVLESQSTEDKYNQLKKLENSNEFLKASPLNAWHPQATAHYLWALYLLKQSGWWNEI